jgi:hypothetical protein
MWWWYEYTLHLCLELALSVYSLLYPSVHDLKVLLNEDGHIQLVDLGGDVLDMLLHL